MSFCFHHATSTILMYHFVTFHHATSGLLVPFCLPCYICCPIPFSFHHTISVVLYHSFSSFPHYASTTLVYCTLSGTSSKSVSAIEFPQLPARGCACQIWFCLLFNLRRTCLFTSIACVIHVPVALMALDDIYLQPFYSKHHIVPMISTWLQWEHCMCLCSL